jgi:DNA-binding response OmpR family regulator
MKLLLAEGQPPDSALPQELLRGWGYEPVVVHDGVDALAALRAPGAPRLALLDWVLPRLDGVGVCREVRRDGGRPYTYVVLVTAPGGPEDLLAGLDAGADDYLVRPVDAARLRARLNTGRRFVTLQDELLAAHRRLREHAAGVPRGCDAWS